MVGTETMFRRQIEAVISRFANMRPLEPVILHRDGIPVEKLMVYQGAGFKS